MARESVTLKELDEAGRDVRAWCGACEREGHVDTIVWEHFAAKGWDMTLTAAAAHFRCSRCRSSAHVTLTPCDRPPQPRTGADIVAAIYFGARREAKERRKGPPPDPLFPSHRVQWWPKRR